MLYYGDADAHLKIARRIVDSQTPGYEQIGTVWLPLLHLLMLPLVRVDACGATGSRARFLPRFASSSADVSVRRRPAHLRIHGRGRSGDGCSPSIPTCSTCNPFP